MDLAFDHHCFDSAGFPASGPAPGPVPGIGVPQGYSVELCGTESTSLPDWSGIKARFQAAHALRRELALAGAGEAHGGGFIGNSQTVLAASRRKVAVIPANCSQGVNPDASANGKPIGALQVQIVGNPDPANEEDYD